MQQQKAKELTRIPPANAASLAGLLNPSSFLARPIRLTGPGRVKFLLLSAFVLLNVADAMLTKVLLARGGQELCFWGISYNSNLAIKSLVPLLIAIILILLNRQKLLVWLNIGMVVVVAINITTFIIMGAWA